MNEHQYLGIDVGGTGIKAALVDTTNGVLLTEKHRELTPQPSEPKVIAKLIDNIVKKFQYEGPIGCGFPSIIHHGVAKSAANIDKKWINVNIEKILQKTSGHRYYAVNDADAAGLAEVAFGHGKGLLGTVIVLTIGTGIGSGMFYDGKLVPNTEFGHLFYKDSVFEKYISNNARKKEDLSWEAWGKRFNSYLVHLEKLFSPDLIVLGGGASKKFDRYQEFLDLDTKVIPAKYQNDAGVLGAAMYAEERASHFLHG